MVATTLEQHTPVRAGAEHLSRIPMPAFFDLESSDTLPDDRRSAPRVPFALTVAYASAQRVMLCRRGDLSESGVFLATDFPDACGTACSVCIDVDGLNLTLAGVVVRVSFDQSHGARAGMSVCFAAPTAAARALLCRVCAHG